MWFPWGDEQQHFIHQVLYQLFSNQVISLSYPDMLAATSVDIYILRCVLFAYYLYALI